jgi:uncharacterized protein (DUF362 family)
MHLRGFDLTSKVAIVEFNVNNVKESLRRAIDLIGGIEPLNTAKKPVIIKVGVFSHKAKNHASVSVADSIISLFDKAPKIHLAESDNYRGAGSERLQLWKELFTKRVTPLNFSEDPEPKSMKLAEKEVNLPSVLLKPKVLVDTHILRSFESGSILKNLFGCILDSKRVKYHEVLPTLLADVFEAIGGIDLAILDGTHLWQGAGNDPVRLNALIVGKDAVAVETVGAVIAGLNPQKMPVIQEFVKRGLGEGDMRNIEVAGTSLESIKSKYQSAAKIHKKPRRKAPKT